MHHITGIFFAFVALVSWGFGDFFIQRTVRLIGSSKALFCIGIVGMVTLMPFVKNDITSLSSGNIFLLLLLGTIVIFTALFDFEALRRGKIAIIEPVIGLELPVTIGLSIMFAHESLSLIQILLITIVFVGIILSITERKNHLLLHKRIFERGVILAGVGAIGMALTNFLVGVGSQSISPLMTIWFAHSMLAIIFGIHILYTRKTKKLISDLKKYTKPILGQSILDNIAWIGYAKATTIIPISIATTISESYVALAVILGIFINKEKLEKHQLFGVVLASFGVIILSYFS